MRFLDYMSTTRGRVIRIAAGIALMASGAALGGAWWGLTVFGALPLATGVLGVCPISPLVGRPFRGGAGRAPLRR